MPSAYTQNSYYTVFSTKHRAMLITSDLEERLYPFMGGILRDLRCDLLAINGMPDHAHLLIRYRADPLRHAPTDQGAILEVDQRDLAAARTLIMAAGFRRVHRYKSAVPEVETYIARQKEHHQRMDFKTPRTAASAWD